MGWKESLHYVGIIILVGAIVVVTYLGIERLLRILEALRNVPT